MNENLMEANMETLHGGDIYRNKVNMDFSVNTNPLGMPKEVEAALYEAVKASAVYPDIMAEELKKAVSGMLQLPEEYFLFGNGASELFMAVVHGIRPQKTVIPVPSFYGYEHAAKAGEGEVVYYETKEDNGFCPGKDLFGVLSEDVDLLFLANPGNPTGCMMDRAYLESLLSHCREHKITVVLDECFMEFCGEENSMLWEAGKFENLILVRAFTKIFAVPGVRLGYLCCKDQPLLEKIKGQLPEWNTSCFAQAAGIACAKQEDFIKKTAAYVGKERQFLVNGLKNLGCKVYPGWGNFILVYSEIPLYEALLKRGILIRDCQNFRGLSKGFYRIAVRTGEENRILLKEIGALKWEKQEG